MTDGDKMLIEFGEQNSIRNMLDIIHCCQERDFICRQNNFDSLSALLSTEVVFICSEYVYGTGVSII